MIEVFIIQNIWKITAAILGASTVYLARQPKKKTDMDILLQKMCDIEDRISNRGF